MLLQRDEETIIALCTPKGSGAIALLRLSGVNAREITSSIARLPSGKSLSSVLTHTIHYGSIVNKDVIIDQVLFLVMDSPRTFTGQNTVEITCHNNAFIIDAIIALAIEHGARLAHEGEFTKRAFLSGKIDLVQAEAINELIHANTQIALKQSLAQLEGSFSSWINLIQTQLIKSLAWCEASFEFLDDEEEFGIKIKTHLESLLVQIAQLKKTFDQQQQIRQGIKIALIGSVNAGKSSIFNALLNQKRSIVTEIAGTTRDVIEAGLYRNGNYWTLLDTAGLRNTHDVIEREGIRRAEEEAQKADVILLVFDGSRKLTLEETAVYENLLILHAQKIILVYNKFDLPKYSEHPLIDKANIAISGLTKLKIDSLEKLIEEKIATLFSTIESPFLLNQRQFNLLIELEKKIMVIITMLEKAIQYELVSYHLKDALETISELSGRSVSEAGLDMVFKEFCVGK